MKVYIQWTYKTKKKKSFTFSSELVSIEEALQFAEDVESTKRVSDIVFTDEKDATWSTKELKKLIAKIEEEPHDITIFFDGGFDQQTRVAGVGCSIYYKKEGETYRIRKNAQLDGLVNNNEAEYAALELAIQVLAMIGVRNQRVVLKGDSQVVLHQLSGEWACYEESFQRYIGRIEQQAKKLRIDFGYEVLPRKANREAHQLATQALEGIAIESHSPIHAE
jgi:ribonuclease HI